MTRFIVAAMSFAILLCGPATAGGLDIGKIRKQIKLLTKPIVIPVAPIAIRTEPPGFFQGAGTQIGQAKPGENFVVIDQKTVPTIIGRDEWLRVQNAANPAETGWISAAPAGAAEANVKLAE